MNELIFTTSFVHAIPLHLEHLLSSPGSTICWEEYHSRLKRCEDVSPDGIADMGVSLTYFNAQGPIEGAYQIECRENEYEVSICEEEGSWN